jgi:hypothetical protein
MTYRDDLDALALRVRSLDTDVVEATRARDEAQRLYEESVQRTKLPVLEDVRVAAPCNADWSKMKGDLRVRHCAQCDQNVYDLSAMTRAEAEALVNSAEARVCIRFFTRADGTVLTSDCSVGVRRRRRRRAIAVAAIAGVTAAATFVGVGVTTMGARRRPDEQQMAPTPITPITPTR